MKTYKYITYILFVIVKKYLNYKTKLIFNIFKLFFSSYIYRLKEPP